MRVDTSRRRVAMIWAVVAIATVVPVVIAVTSPLLAWRSPVYIAAGFGGIVAMSVLLLQPLLAGGLLPGLSIKHARSTHRWTGTLLVLAIAIHVIGLWITSPPDVVDALLLVSATPFSIWGVVAMWSVLISACLVLFRRKSGMRVTAWRLTHRFLGVVTVAGSVVHAMMIEGAMGTVSKAVLCAMVVVATGLALWQLRNKPR